jgi:hypothetical protein
MQDGTKVVSISGDQSVSGDVLIRRKQIAAQVVAVMCAHFSRPGAGRDAHTSTMHLIAILRQLRT